MVGHMSALGPFGLAVAMSAGALVAPGAGWAVTVSVLVLACVLLCLLLWDLESSMGRSSRVEDRRQAPPRPPCLALRAHGARP